MGFVRTRIDGSSTPRYLALYQDVKGRQRAAGTFNRLAQAERAWRRAEDRISEGRLGDASRGRQKFARYVEETWLPHHQMEARTRENSMHNIARHDLLFTMGVLDPQPGNETNAESGELGLTDTNATGRTYRHGTITAYNMAPCAVSTAATRTPPTAPPAAPPAKTPPAPPEPPPTPPATCPATGSAATSGNPPSRQLGSTPPSAPTTSATLTPPGCSPAAPTSKPSKNASATAASPPPSNTCTPSPAPTTPPWPHLAPSATPLEAPEADRSRSQDIGHASQPCHASTALTTERSNSV
jgi:hypothetical protein